MISSGKAIVISIIATSVLLSSCTMPWSKTSEETNLTSTQTSGSGQVTKKYSDDELSKIKPEDLVLKAEDASNEAKRNEFKDKVDQYRNYVLKKVAFNDEAGFKGPEDIKSFMKNKGFTFDKTEFSFSSDLGGYTYLSQSGSTKLGIQYGSRQWEAVNEYISRGGFEKRPELKSIFVPSYEIEIGLDDTATVTSVTEKRINMDTQTAMGELQKKIMKLNMEISGRNPMEPSSAGVAPTKEELTAKYDEIRKLEEQAKSFRDTMFIMGGVKTDSPLIGKKIWEFSAK